MATLATTDDVAARLQRPLVGDEAITAAVLLDEVSAMARRAIPTVDELVVPDQDYATVVAGVLSGAVARVLRNPEGRSQETVGPFAYRRAESVADGSLYLSGEEISRLRPVVSSARVGSQKLAARGYGAL